MSKPLRVAQGLGFANKKAANTITGLEQSGHVYTRDFVSSLTPHSPGVPSMPFA